MVDIGKYIVYILYIHIAHLNVKGLFLPTEPISELMNWGPTFFFASAFTVKHNLGKFQAVRHTHVK